MKTNEIQQQVMEAFVNIDEMVASYDAKISELETSQHNIVSQVNQMIGAKTLLNHFKVRGIQLVDTTKLPTVTNVPVTVADNQPVSNTEKTRNDLRPIN